MDIWNSGGMIGRIMAFAKGFGSVLGKLFLPVTIVMSAFDFITGFIETDFKSRDWVTILYLNLLMVLVVVYLN